MSWLETAAMFYVCSAILGAVVAFFAVLYFIFECHKRMK